MKIALVNPPPRREYEKHWARFPVLGLAYVASALRAAGHEVALLDGKLDGLSVDAIVERIAATSPGLVGITCMTVEYAQAAAIAERIKARAPAPIVVGGAHVNAVGAQALEECRAFDFACIDEGEHLACELAAAVGEGRPLDSIAGLAFRRGAGIVENRRRDYPPDYDALPFPAWDLFRVGDEIPILTHRGCPFQCTFCGHNSGFKPRYRSPENVLAEIEEIVARYRPRTVRFEDETFGLNLPRTKQILRGILDRGLEGKVAFSAQTRVDRIDVDFIRLLKRCNFATLELGVESGNPGVLERVRKGITLDQVERAVRLAKEERLKVWCKFILGHPHETRETVMDTVRFIARLNPDQLSVSVMTPYPGTPIYEMALRGEGGYRLLSRDWARYDKYASGALELEGLSLGELKLYQILSYLRLYVQNGRFRELASLVTGHRRMAAEMLVDAAVHLSRRRGTTAPPAAAGPGGERPRPPGPAPRAALPRAKGARGPRLPIVQS
ncbi:radical SAM protein [Sorangium sp. So ce134]